MVDTRSVNLSRLGAAYEWQTNDGGVITKYGDTTYDYFRSISGIVGSGLKVNTQAFSVSFAGGWSSYGSHKWTPSNCQQTPTEVITATSNSFDMPQGNLTDISSIVASTPQWTAPSSGGKASSLATIGYSYTDSADQAQAQAQYNLTVHEPIEIDHTNSISGSAGPYPLCNPDGTLAGYVAPIAAGGTDTSAPHTFSMTGNYGFSSGWAFGVDGGLDIGVAKNLLGIDLGGASIGVNAQYSWQNYFEQANTPGITYTPPLQPGQGLYVTYSIGYNDNTAYYRYYQPGGEVKKSGSPLPQPGVSQAPQPSIPWVWKYQTKLGLSMAYKVVDTSLGKSFPNPPSTHDVTLPSPKVS